MTRSSHERVQVVEVRGILSHGKKETDRHTHSSTKMSGRFADYRCNFKWQFNESLAGVQQAARPLAVICPDLPRRREMHPPPLTRIFQQ